MSISQAQPAGQAVRHTDGKIGVLFAETDRYAGQIVGTALARSFTTAQVAMHGPSTAGNPPSALVWINPPDSSHLELAQTVSAGGKAVVFGHLGPRVAEFLGLDLAAPSLCRTSGQSVPVDRARRYDESAAAIRYGGAHPLVAESPFRRAPLPLRLRRGVEQPGLRAHFAVGRCWSLAIGRRSRRGNDARAARDARGAIGWCTPPCARRIARRSAVVQSAGRTGG